MDREQVRKEHGAFHEPGGARLRRALTDSCGWEIRARRSLAPPFMVQMRGCKTVETAHEPSRLRVADPRSGPRLCEAQRFMVPMRAQKRMEAFHEPPLSRPSATLSPPCGERAGRGVPIWFMVPMRAQKRKEASHEPGGARLRRALIPVVGRSGPRRESRPTVYGPHARLTPLVLRLRKYALSTPRRCRLRSSP